MSILLTIAIPTFNRAEILDEALKRVLPEIKQFEEFIELIVSDNFSALMLYNQHLQYANNSNYVGHIVQNDAADDGGIRREIRNMYCRCNMLIRRFNKCSVSVKLILFCTYCICLCDVALWNNYNVGTMDRLRSCYNKCIKMFFWF